MYDPGHACQAPGASMSPRITPPVIIIHHLGHFPTITSIAFLTFIISTQTY
jgi:hypothetical protein